MPVPVSPTVPASFTEVASRVSNWGRWGDTDQLGTLNLTALTVESLAAHNVPFAGLVIGNWPLPPGVVEASNRSALVRMGPMRAELPAGAGQLSTAEFTAMSAPAFDRAWVTSLLS